MKKQIQIFALMLMGGCEFPALVPYGQPQASIRTVSVGVFEFSFERKVVDSYGSTRNEAVQRFLSQQPELLPPDCHRGVEILQSGDTEAGGGWVRFACNNDSR